MRNLTRNGLSLPKDLFCRALTVIPLLALAAGAMTPVELHGRLEIKGNRIVDKAGFPVRLDGMALFWSQWQPQYWNSSCVRWLAEDWKCGIIRASMAIENGGYLTNRQAETDKVKRVIEAAIANGVYVVVDWHDHYAHNHVDAAKAFFADIAKAYGHAPNIIYETFNEPWSGQGWKESIKPYHEQVIPAIRQYDPDNLILLGTPNWSQDVDVASKDPVTSSANLLYTLHFYAGTHRQSFRDKAEIALRNGMALMVTEGGLSEASGTGAVDTVEARKWFEYMRARNISWMNWSVCDKVESSAALKQGSSGAGGWNESSLTPSGKWVRAAIRSSYQDGSSVVRRDTPAWRRGAVGTGVGVSIFKAGEGGEAWFNAAGRAFEPVSVPFGSAPARKQAR